MTPAEKLQGEVDRLVYSADETGYTICRLRVPGEHDLLTVVGSLPGIQPGEKLSLEGRWVNHPKFGLQFQASRYTSQVPATANAIKRYLSSNLVKGIGPVMAGRLVERFGDNTLEVIEQSPQRLSEVSGIGPGRVKSIQRAWEAQKEVREVMLFLQGHGVSSAYATRIYRAYGQDSMAIVKENPYRLAQDIRGIGFKTADRIAQDIGIAFDSPYRAQAALEYTLSEIADEGNVFSPLEELIEGCIQRVEIPQELLLQAAQSLHAEGRILIEEEAVYLSSLYQAERGTADAL